MVAPYLSLALKRGGFDWTPRPDWPLVCSSGGKLTNFPSLQPMYDQG